MGPAEPHACVRVCVLVWVCDFPSLRSFVRSLHSLTVTPWLALRDSPEERLPFNDLPFDWRHQTTYPVRARACGASRSCGAASPTRASPLLPLACRVSRVP